MEKESGLDNEMQELATHSDWKILKFMRRLGNGVTLRYSYVAEVV